MEAVEYIQKDKRNEHFGYKFASEQAVKETLHPILVKNKVILQVSVKNVRREVYTSKNGGRGAITDLDVEYAFYDVESGESLTGSFVGTGDDGADKGTYKAITGAIKYILTSTFLIPTGDDPENDSEAKISIQQKTSVKQPLQPYAGPPPFGDGSSEVCKDCGAPLVLYKTSKKMGCSKYCWKPKA
jgi:hypothetical protein